MSDDQFRPPFGIEEADDDRDERALPEHEQDPDDTVGGGLIGAGGTAIDRGTGTLGGEAQGKDADAGADDALGVDQTAVPGPPAGGAQTYEPAYADDDDEAMPDR